MKTFAVVLLLASSASAACYSSWPRYARTQGNLSQSEWRAKYAVKPYRKADYDRGNVSPVVPYSGGPVTILNPFCKQTEQKPAFRVRNSDGSETIFNPYCF